MKWVVTLHRPGYALGTRVIVVNVANEKEARKVASGLCYGGDGKVWNIKRVVPQ